MSGSSPQRPLGAQAPADAGGPEGNAGLRDSLAFAEQFYAEGAPTAGPLPPVALEARLRAVSAEWAATGAFTPNEAELAFGARVAWRNSTRCIGRLFWPALQVRDLRHVSVPDEVYAHLLSHLQDAYAGGHIQPIISVFGPGVRVLNSQLLRYAGYRLPGTAAVQGDPENIALTELATELGWRGSGGRFDLLPLIIEAGGKRHLYPVPPDLVKEVEITHPDLPQIAALGLKWPALPVISDATLRIGGTTFGCAPFNGWYMQTEIAARNLADHDRYDALPALARALGLDTRHERSLWRDRALLELNVAVLHSFREAGVKIVDHHTAAAQFVRFQEREAAAGREVRGQWSWLIPPMSPATTPVWGQSFRGRELSPRYERPGAGTPPLASSLAAASPDPRPPAAPGESARGCPRAGLEQS